jgi:hypothetical protein
VYLFRWIRDEVAFVCVCVLVLCGVLALAIWPDHWRPDVSIIAAALFVAAILRLALPTPRAGALAARTRWFDVVAYTALGGVILALAIRLH